MNFTQALAALDARIPERMVPDLQRMRALSELLGHPQTTYPSLHITGTNGKTTTAAVATQLLRAAGLSTGTYTSPHLTSVTERIACDAQPITERAFAEGYTFLEPFLEAVDARGERVTYFETLTMLAEICFAEQAVDAAVVEVGMGGVWDATNLIDGRAAVITDVTMDHPQLGSTPAEIAVEKAGIIKQGAFVVTATRDREALAVIRVTCNEREAELREFGLDFDLESLVLAVGGQSLVIRVGDHRYEDIFLPLFGSALARDAVLALAAVHGFLGERELGDDLVAEAFANVRSPGRLEVMRRAPLVIVDGAHNPAASEALARGLRESFRYERLILVASVLADKDIPGVLAPLASQAALVIATQNLSPRAAPADRIAKEATAFGVAVETVGVVADAVATALERASERDCICVSGSLYTVGEARKLFTH
jgi:dihydrofolate synthase/folylpolyglutamate synthase